MNEVTQTTTNAVATDQLVQDFKAATFIVSVFINVAVLTAWLVIQFHA